MRKEWTRFDDISRRGFVKAAGIAPFSAGVVSTSTVVSGSEAGAATGLTLYVGESEQQLGSGGGHVYAVDAATGAIVWKARPDRNGKQSALTVVDGTLYVGANRGFQDSGSQLHALDARTGDLLWSWDRGGGQGNFRGGLTVSHGLVFVGSWNDYTLYAVNIDTGTVVWSYRTDSITGYAAPNVVAGTLYFSSLDGVVHALDVTDGSVEWVFDTGTGSTYSQPTVYNGVVYVGAEGGSGGLWAIDASTGTERWSSEDYGRIRASPTIVDGVVYIGSRNATLYAVDASSGAEIWAFEAATGLYISSPTVANGVVYSGNHDRSLYAVNAADGTERWRFTEPTGQVYSSPTVYAGVVYVGSSTSSGGALWAVDADTGERLWVMDDPAYGLSSSPTIVADPDEGDSVGSRVLLGTLGHHHAWTGTDGLTARFEYAPASPMVGEPVVFDGTGSITPIAGTTYRWDLTGDGGTDAEGETVESTYGSGGDRTVRLTITDPDGNQASTERTLEVMEPLVPIGGFENLPRDLDGDGLFEDVNGDGTADVVDVQALHRHLDDDLLESRPELFDFSGTDPTTVTYADVEALFERVTGGGNDA